MHLSRLETNLVSFEAVAIGGDKRDIISARNLCFVIFSLRFKEV